MEHNKEQKNVKHKVFTKEEKLELVSVSCISAGALTVGFIIGTLAERCRCLVAISKVLTSKS